MHKELSKPLKVLKTIPKIPKNRNEDEEITKIRTLFNIEELLNVKQTNHFQKERLTRWEDAKEIIQNNNDYVEAILIVNKQHEEGVELHCITHNALIFTLNKDKFLNGEECLTSILFARPEQLEHYGIVNYKPDNHTMQMAKNYKLTGKNLE